MTNDLEFLDKITTALKQHYPDVAKADPRSVVRSLSNLAVPVAMIYASIISIVGADAKDQMAKHFDEQVNRHLAALLVQILNELGEYEAKKGDGGGDNLH